MLRIAFAGTPEFAVPALRALHAAGHAVVGVLTQPDRRRGRGQHLASSPVKLEAEALGLPVSQPESLKSESARADLSVWRPDVLVVVAYGLLLPPAVLALPPLGCVNIHASLLPRWRGAAPIQHAILAGDAESGITIMRLDAGLDTGPILLQRAIPIGPTDTGGSLGARLAQLGPSLLLEALAALAAGKLRERVQPATGVTYAPKIAKAEGRIDWRQDAQAIERRVRAFNPWPTADTRLNGEPLKVLAAVVTRESGGGPAAAAEPGRVLGVLPDGILVQCGRGQLALREVQRAGRRPVSADEFARGTSLAGRRFE